MNTVITGGNRGIGLELVKLFLDRGDQVFVICRQSNSELKALGVTIIDGIDLLQPFSKEKILNILSGKKIDLFINNAGLFENETIDNMNFETIQKQIMVNTIAPLQLVDCLLPLMNNDSKIALLSSRMGSIKDNTSGSYYGYRMSKAALNAAGKSLAIDLRPKSISVALLHPGYVKTKMTNYNGDITPEVAAKGLFQQIQRLDIKTTGSFWHSNSEELDW